MGRQAKGGGRMNWIAPQTYTGGNGLCKSEGKLSGTSPLVLWGKKPDDLRED